MASAIFGYELSRRAWVKAWTPFTARKRSVLKMPGTRMEMVKTFFNKESDFDRPLLYSTGYAAK